MYSSKEQDRKTSQVRHEWNKTQIRRTTQTTTR